MKCKFVYECMSILNVKYAYECMIVAYVKLSFFFFFFQFLDNEHPQENFNLIGHIISEFF
jgi:hypothetical protein